MDKIKEKIDNYLKEEFSAHYQSNLVWIYFKFKVVKEYDLNYLKYLDGRGELESELLAVMQES